MDNPLGMEINDPDIIAIAGDWHGNTRWGVAAVREICQRLPGEVKLILQAGDFGFWDNYYLTALNCALKEENASLWFIDGNHENHDALDAQTPDPDGNVWISPRMRWLKRGTRWSWHDRTWLACGGAVSVDKHFREEGISWFPQEEITDEQEAAIIAGGPADVMLCHDVPTDCPLGLPVAPQEWLPMIPAAEAHRDRLRRICKEVKPSHFFHGHYHKSQVRAVETLWGDCEFVTLDCDGRQGNWIILDTRTMEWEWQ